MDYQKISYDLNFFNKMFIIYKKLIFTRIFVLLATFVWEDLELLANSTSEKLAKIIPSPLIFYSLNYNPIKALSSKLLYPHTNRRKS